MILIADGGSTKCDWVVVSFDGKEIKKMESEGLHPRFVNSEIVRNALINMKELMELSSQIKFVFFYGAGCSSDALNNIIKRPLNEIFVNAQIKVDHDLKGAALSAYFGKPALICILGTGSNVCYFDGSNLKKETPSLGWILGDEGSGVYLGKKLLHSFFTDKMPKYLSLAFKERYNLSIEDVLENVYQKPKANSYIATFNRFIAEHKREPFILNLVYESFKAFFENQVLIFAEAKSVEINFIGSIAHYYEDIIKTVASEYHVSVGEIVKKPIDNLVKYHLIYILPNLRK
ncbi:ATPase [Apibacter raozihei]|uniref:BadF/BadG/BcrA/BcrD ATPase family protein n=1 Tax=Apibacter TaxID=1778601 RepID=UPI000FE3158B|nr:MULTISPECIES: BadF/BadG/BcrA/BcrD ATPase family protein [Apibacter]